MSDTLVLSCPKCGTRVRLRDGEQVGRCEVCNGLVERASGVRGDGLGQAPRGEEQSLTPTVVLFGSLLLIVAGAAAFRTFRKGGVGSFRTAPTASSAAPISQPPPEVAPAQAPAGEIAWDSAARSPIVVSLI